MGRKTRRGVLAAALVVLAVVVQTVPLPFSPAAIAKSSAARLILQPGQ